ncbi:hypothetical protein [Microbacterium natoriense]
MSARAKYFVFKPVAVVATIVATALTILLPLLQGVAWVNEHAVWIVWVVLLVLTAAAVLLHARLMSVQKALTDARADATRENLRAEDAESRAAEAETRADREARKAADAVEVSNAATESLEAAARLASDARLGDSDRALADKLNEHASNVTVLNELAEFFPYMISQELVNAVRELSELPRIRSPYSAGLKDQLSALSAAADAWFRQFLHVAWTEDDHYSTRLDPVASTAARKEHEEQTDLLVELGFNLHSKLLGYQQYYASLEAARLGRTGGVEA